MSTPSATPSRDSRYYMLDFWRGVACLMVTVFHASFYATQNPAIVMTGPVFKTLSFVINILWAGVPIFFVISGYCITAACDSARARQGATRSYFFRRFRRIFPPYWTLLALSLAFFLVVSFVGARHLYCDTIHPIADPGSLTWLQWLGNVSLTETWRHCLGGDLTQLFLGHAWTLCYEEQFYVVCGLVLWLTRRRFFLALGVVSLAVLPCAWGVLAGKGPSIDGFFFDGKWLLFALGILVYHRIHLAKGLVARCEDAGLLVALAAVLFAWRMTGDRPEAHVFLAELLSGVAFAAAILTLYRWDIRMACSRLLRPVSLCGTMCYSLYLVHWPVVKPLSHALYLAGLTAPWQTFLISIPLCVLVTVALAWVFHVHVERRFLNTPPTLPVRVPDTVWTGVREADRSRMTLRDVKRNFLANLR